MSYLTTTIAIPSALRDLLASRRAAGQTQDAFADSLLCQQLTVVDVERAQGLPLDTVAERYLTDPRLSMAGQRAPTVHVGRDLSERVAELAEQIQTLLGRSVPKGRVIQALLWTALEPLPEGASRVPLPPPAALPTATVNVPAALNATLQECVRQRGARTHAMNTRELLIDTIVSAGFAELDADYSTVAAELIAEQRVAPSDGRGMVTIRVQRHHLARARMLAQELWGGVASYALQALLWRGIDKEVSKVVPDQEIVMDGTLYERVTRLADGTPREFVEAAVIRAVERAERRKHPRTGEEDRHA